MSPLRGSARTPERAHRESGGVCIRAPAAPPIKTRDPRDGALEANPNKDDDVCDGALVATPVEADDVFVGAPEAQHLLSLGREPQGKGGPICDDPPEGATDEQAPVHGTCPILSRSDSEVVNDLSEILVEIGVYEVPTRTRRKAYLTAIDHDHIARGLLW